MAQVKLNSKIAWILVIIGGIVECFWVSGLKYADNFTLYIFTGIGILISFCCAIIAMKHIEVSVAYAVFVGIGTSGVVLSEMLIFNENFSLLKISLIALLLLSVIGLKFVSKENDENTVNELAQNLGLDELDEGLQKLN
ncbi:multidrug efflux SMR transporter [Campylobacter sp. US33a]|uniref:DMT family transporter n=1 Tax=Campylobacter sp. US33a TaxID=2498120 RepID=UPI00106880A0|nr:multidrug efflux SMR transporter [Campylobacter sp. US33a]